MPWEPKREAVICICTRLLSKEASFPLQAAWLQESFREDAVPIERKPIGHQVRITYSKLRESFLFKCRGNLVKKRERVSTDNGSNLLYQFVAYSIHTIWKNQFIFTLWYCPLKYRIAQKVIIWKVNRKPKILKGKVLHIQDSHV